MKPVVLGNIPYGMYAIGVKDERGPSACIVNTVMQITKTSPSAAPLVALSMNAENYSCRCIEENGVFTISVLSEDTPATVIGALGFTTGQHGGKLENIRHKVLLEGVPVIKENTCCWFLCEVRAKLPAGGQVLFVAEIVAGSDITAGKETAGKFEPFKPMTYQYYVEKLGGVSPKRAPTYLAQQRGGERITGERFVCSVCGYEYRDQNFGFEELPADWSCPICKMPKKAFARKKN